MLNFFVRKIDNWKLAKILLTIVENTTRVVKSAMSRAFCHAIDVDELIMALTKPEN